MPSPQLCTVTIGSDHYLLPLKEGTRLLEILSRALPLDCTYSHRAPHWRVREDETGRYELAIVRRDDIDVSEVATPSRARGALRLIQQGGR